MDKKQETQMQAIEKRLREKATKQAMSEAGDFRERLKNVLYEVIDDNGNIIIHEQARCVGWFLNNDINECTKRPGGRDVPIVLWVSTLCDVLRDRYVAIRTEHWYNIEVENLLTSVGKKEPSDFDDRI